MNFILTFPFSDRLRSDGWVRIENARDLGQVIQYADREYKTYAIYKEEDFDEGYYPRGCLETIDLRTWHDYVT